MVRAMSQGSTGRTTVRHDLSTAAINLFLANGYDRTTVDDIAEAAGVARRTFFRHFRTKEDAVFPDHDACLKRVEEHLSRIDPTQPPLVAAGGAAHLVLAMYAEDTQASVRRCQVIREVEPLRERELIATSRYQRAFAEYLHRRLPGRETERLLHELAGSAVVGAHNFVLRQWLREGGTGDVHARFDAAMRTVAGRFPDWLRMQGGVAESERPEEVMVLMLRPDTPQWRIAQEIEAVARTDRGAG
jgi:AcrR family transcriptional regulator